MGRDEDEARAGATPPGAERANGSDGAKARRRGRHRRVVREGTEQSTVDGVGSDELPVGWSDPASEEDGSHDAELRRNVPPHWS